MFSRIILFIVTLIFMLNLGLNSAVAAGKKANSIILPPLASKAEKQQYIEAQKAQTTESSGVKASHILTPIEFTDPNLSMASVRTYLISDYDGDGFYSAFSHVFDVDTNLVSQNIYIDIYIRYIGGSWEFLDSTSDFTIFGHQFDDTEIAVYLESGYFPDYYDIRIDVRDADDPRYGVSYYPANFSALGDIPLEDEIEDDDIYLGSTGFMTLFLLASLLFWRMHSRKAIRVKN